MTSSEVCFVSKQLAGGLQAHRFADKCKCLACCLYNDGVVQAVTFGYLINWLVLVSTKIFYFRTYLCVKKLCI